MSSPTETSSLASWVQFQARLNPHAIAIFSGSRQVTYGAFSEHIDRFSRRLAAQGIAAGTRASVTVDDEYLHWLAVIALARLEIISVSLPARPEGHAYARAQVVLTDGAEVQGPRNVKVDATWFTKPADGLAAVGDKQHAWDAPCRIVFSSGTTGVPKKVMLTYGDLRMRYLATARAYGLNATARLFVTMGIMSVGGFWGPVSTWVGGGSVILAASSANEGFARQFMRTQPNVVLASTVQLALMVNALPPDYWPVQQAVVYVTGSPLPAPLNRRARVRLSQALFIIYGSTEAGTVTMAHAAGADGQPGFTGYALPTVRVQIVDEAGNEVAPGETGEVRIRADGGATGYLDDDAASAQFFRDGWFHPGDLGRLGKDGALRILGRTSEVLNIGGMKFSPHQIEDSLAGVAGVTDLAVFSVESGGELARPGIALVAGQGFDEQALVQRFRKSYDVMPDPVVLRVDAIPRNDMGKVQRLQLAEKAAALAG